MITKSEFPGNKSIALLLDPDKADRDYLEEILKIAADHSADYILAGGSLTFKSIGQLISSVREMCPIPVVLFPGNLLQISLEADAILLLSLISGRNPELLIGNHVIAAPVLKDVRDRLISVGYILTGNGKKTSVEYMSQTEPIPCDKPEIIIATAMAGEMLGLNMIYLEAGSGADQPVRPGIIKQVRDNISVPLAVGGGLRSINEIRETFIAGANLVVLGNSCERNPGLLADACRIRDSLR